MLLAPAPPFRIHKDYAKFLSWYDWISIGPLTQYLPISSLLSLAMGSKFKTADSAEKVLRQVTFDKMDLGRIARKLVPPPMSSSSSGLEVP